MSSFRNKHGCPAFYCLNNKAILIQEPTTTLSAVAEIVPPSLRGKVYDTYLIDAQHDWQDHPSYILDEFIAYTQGGLARKELGIQDRYEEVCFGIEFIVYSVCVARASGSDDQLREFLRWNIERILNLQEGPSEYLNKLRMSEDAESLRSVMRRYFGATWTKRVFGW